MPYLHLKQADVSYLLIFHRIDVCLWQAVVRDLPDLGLTCWAGGGVHPVRPGPGQGKPDVKSRHSTTVAKGAAEVHRAQQCGLFMLLGGARRCSSLVPLGSSGAEPSHVVSSTEFVATGFLVTDDVW